MSNSTRGFVCAAWLLCTLFGLSAAAPPASAESTTAAPAVEATAAAPTVEATAAAHTGEGNVLMEYFSANFDCKVADLSKLKPQATVHVPNVNIPQTAENNPMVYGIRTGTNWAARFTGLLYIASGGAYTFQIDKWHADSAALAINGQTVFSSKCGINSPKAKLSLPAGVHEVVVIFTDDGWQDKLVLSYQGPDTDDLLTVVPQSRFTEAEWVLGKEGQDCTSVCQARGKACDASALAGVDTAAGILRAAAEASYSCSSTVPWSYDNLPGICTNSGCCLDGSCTGACAYGATRPRTCAGKAPGHYSRLCPCSMRAGLV